MTVGHLGHLSSISQVWSKPFKRLPRHLVCISAALCLVAIPLAKAQDYRINWACQEAVASHGEPATPDGVARHLHEIDSMHAVNVCTLAWREDHPASPIGAFHLGRAQLAPGPLQDIPSGVHWMSAAWGLGGQEGAIELLGRELAEWYRTAAMSHFRVDTFEVATNEGDPIAQTLLAMVHLNQRLPEYDRAAAISLLERASEADYAGAMNLLASIRGVDGDQAGQVHLLTRAANQGHARSMFDLGMIHLRGFDGEPNHQLGLAWIQRAAVLGNRDALLRINQDGLSARERSLMDSSGTIWVPAHYSEPDGEEIMLAIVRGLCRYGTCETRNTFTYGPILEPVWHITVADIEKHGCIAHQSGGYECTFTPTLYFRSLKNMTGGAFGPVDYDSADKLAARLNSAAPRPRAALFLLGVSGWRSPDVESRGNFHPALWADGMLRWWKDVHCNEEAVAAGADCPNIILHWPTD